MPMDVANVRSGPAFPLPPRIVATILIGLAPLVGSAPTAWGEEKIVFNRDIRPILSENCFACHGPDKNQRKADLRLDVPGAAAKQGSVVAGKPDESELIVRIESDDPDEMMPPPKLAKAKLTPEQKALLRRWVAEGAVFQDHWAYEKPVKASVPAGSNPIDYLVGRHLESLGAKPSPEADRRTLARRLYFDLVGLPPTPEQVEAFVNDKAADAYARLVERLLESPHYGERMAIGWLDVVRFADTIGYHSDNPMNVWPYRDYVIRAFNRNLPFDRFTVEQLAGDLLPGSTDEQKVASGFNRMLLTTQEGGAQPKDYEARMLTDRVRAVGTVWLGHTFGCCQCHDHKFDPISARDFYSLGAFFADIQETIIGAREEGMIVTDANQAVERARLRQALDNLQLRWDDPNSSLTPGIAASRSAWEAAALADVSGAGRWTILPPDQLATEGGTKLSKDSDGAVSVSRTSKGGVDAFRVTVKTTLKGINGFRLDALAPADAPTRGPGRAANGNFVISELSITDAAGKPVPLAHASATFEQSGFPASSAIDGKTDKGNGWGVALPTGETAGSQAIVVETAAPLGDGSALSLTFTLRQLHGDAHTLARFRFAATTAPRPIRAPGAVAPSGGLEAILRLDPAKRDAAQQARLTAHYRAVAPELAGPRAGLAAARQALVSYEAALPRSLVSVALEKPRTVRILPRGNWMDESGPVVVPTLPHYLAKGFKTGEGRLTRLDLARWIVSNENPLTARVFVNRLWKQFFGIGLSKNSDDFGSQGEWPVNPELLDWLACEFRDDGWDVKRLVRAIVNSHTYKQVSTASKEWLTRDPANRLLARQGRFRLDAELVRDNALAVSGLLAREVGGPSVKPYQPAGYWENLNFPPRAYVADASPEQYRRGLYTWWQRTYPHPSLLAFDAPTREECTADRARSNTPQQALVLLNDPTYVEAARAFAARIVREGGDDTAARIRWAWRQAVQHDPAPADSAELAALVDRLRSHYASDPKAAEALLGVGAAPRPSSVDPAELAAWTNAARVILSLHETITRN